MNKIFYTSVAGINFRARPEDVGQIIGYVEQDPTNSYNPKAVAVRRIGGELLGYVAERDLDQFYQFKGEGYDTMAFAGNIKKVDRGGRNFYVGNIAIFRSSNNKELEEMIEKHWNDDFNIYGKTEIK